MVKSTMVDFYHENTNIVPLLPSSIHPQKITNPTCDQMQINSNNMARQDKQSTRLVSPSKYKIYTRLLESIFSENLIKKRTTSFPSVDYVCGIYYQIATHSFYLLVSSIQFKSGGLAELTKYFIRKRTNQKAKTIECSGTYVLYFPNFLVYRNKASQKKRYLMVHITSEVNIISFSSLLSDSEYNFAMVAIFRVRCYQDNNNNQLPTHSISSYLYANFISWVC